MSVQMNDQSRAPQSNTWLKSYYYLRFAVSAAWVAVAFTIAKNNPPLAAVTLIAYPVWDALANYVDAQRSGGLGRNKSQLLNVVVSIVATIAVAIALGRSMNAVLSVYGVWAVVSGAFQLLTAVRRWKINGAQWAMILSGAQSALAGLFFVRWRRVRRLLASPTLRPMPLSAPSTSSCPPCGCRSAVPFASRRGP